MVFFQASLIHFALVVTIKHFLRNTDSSMLWPWHFKMLKICLSIIQRNINLAPGPYILLLCLSSLHSSLFYLKFHIGEDMTCHVTCRWFPIVESWFDLMPNKVVLQTSAHPVWLIVLLTVTVGKRLFKITPLPKYPNALLQICTAVKIPFCRTGTLKELTIKISLLIQYNGAINNIPCPHVAL